MRASVTRSGGIALLVLLYLFLYGPIAYVIYVSFQTSSVWPFPADLTLDHHASLWQRDDYRIALGNSLLIGLGTGLLSMVLAVCAGVAMLKYRPRMAAVMVAVFVGPLFIPPLLIGIAGLLFNEAIIGFGGGIGAAVLANATYTTAFSFLVVLAQLSRHDWRLDEAATVMGARPLRIFLSITAPLIWPAMFGAFLVSFLLAFNNLEISFYNLGATPTLPSVAWGSLRHGLAPELYALAAEIIILIFVLLATLWLLLRFSAMRLFYKD